MEFGDFNLGTKETQPSRDIRAHLEEICGLRVSADLVSRVTDAVLNEVSDWQSRALEPMYPIVFLDAFRVKRGGPGFWTMLAAK